MLERAWALARPHLARLRPASLLALDRKDVVRDDDGNEGVVHGDVPVQAALVDIPGDGRLERRRATKLRGRRLPERFGGPAESLLRRLLPRARVAAAPFPHVIALGDVKVIAVGKCIGGISRGVILQGRKLGHRMAATEEHVI